MNRREIDRRIGPGLAIAAAAFALSTADAKAEIATFFFAQVGNSYSAFPPGDDPIVGQEIVEARIFLNLNVTAGDAASFFTDISFPLDPLPGNDSALVLTGEELGWSGVGPFEYTETSQRFNGTFVSRRFGAETPGEGYEGQILEGSRIEFEYVPEPGTALGLLFVGGLSLMRRWR
jgi:hypothetical protein